MKGKSLIFCISILLLTSFFILTELEGAAITGSITSGSNLSVILAYNRQNNKRYYGQVIVPNRYRIDKLDSGTYDLFIKACGYFWEGIDLGEQIYEGDQLNKEDETFIVREIENSEPFFNIKNIWRLEGSKRYAGSLVEMIRDKAFTRNSGEHVTGILTRRIDLFHFKKSGAVWLITRRVHLYREEVPLANSQINSRHIYHKQLNGFKIAPGSETLHKEIDLSQ